MTDLKLPLRVRVGAHRWIEDADGRILMRCYDFADTFINPNIFDTICEAVNASRDVGRDAVVITDDMVERACDAFQPLNLNDGRPENMRAILTREYLRRNVCAALEAALRDEKGKQNEI